MKKIKLSEGVGEKNPEVGGYQLDPTEKYVINLQDEMKYQATLFMCFQTMGFPPAIKNYQAWLHENGFNVEMPNPTNEFVSAFYGVKPLWKTAYSQGIVVKAVGEKDFYIVMECSHENKGYGSSKIILTPGGCC